MRIKICGVTNADDVALAVECGADALGFVLAPSKRRLSLAGAAALARWLPPFVARVAVMVDPSEGEALEAARTGLFTHLQLHGSETAEFCAGLPLPVVKAFRLTSRDDLERARAFAAASPGTALLLDGPSGGSGLRCDWELARELGEQAPVVLAGGLTPDNVAEAIRAAAPAAVDVSSGVEESPGRKSPSRLRAFVQAARAAAEGRR
jgi:phosphoribosylanthranilate isomerase